MNFLEWVLGVLGQFLFICIGCRIYLQPGKAVKNDPKPEKPKTYSKK